MIDFKNIKEVMEVLNNPGFDVEKVRKDFQYLDIEGENIIYLDNAATTQRPRQVIEQIAEYYKYENANPLRGNHKLSLLSTQAYEKSREHVRKFINADYREEIVFTRNATESLNLVAYAWGLQHLKANDEVLITRMEHHSNCVNWQFICEKTGAKLVYAEVNDDYGLDEEDFIGKINNNTKIVSFSGASNVLSAVPNAEKLIRAAHEKGAIAILDGAQLVPHEKVDVNKLDCDFLAFSGHKMLAPFGIGILYGKKSLLNEMNPFLLGGEMIEYVNDFDSTFAELPYKFEAGTQNVGGAVGLDAAISYIESIGIDKIEAYEKALGEYCAVKLRELGDVEVYHPANGSRGAAVAFNIKGAHPHDVSTIMDFKNIAIRSGHHCAQPLHRALKIDSSCRASFAFYNTKEEIDEFISSIEDVRKTMEL